MCWTFWPRGMWDLTPQPRIKHTLLALEGEVLTIGPPEKSPFMFSVMIIFTWFWFPICYTLGGRERSWATMWSPIISFWLHRKPSHFQQFSWYSQNIHIVRAPSPQLCPTLWPYGLQLLCPQDSPGKNTVVGCHFLLQGIFPTQGSNSRLLHCRWTLYPLSYPGTPHMIQHRIL